MNRGRSNEGVELNVTAMLDMAFQLLAFFILTFKPGPDEPAFCMKLPSLQAAIVDRDLVTETPGPELEIKPFVPAGLKTVRIDLYSTTGGFDRMLVNDVPAATLADLRAKVTALVHPRGSPVEQVVVQASDRVQYANLMQVVGICAEQEPRGAKELVKLRLVAMGDGAE